MNRPSTTEKKIILLENFGEITEILRNAAELCLEWRTFYRLCGEGEGGVCYKSPDFTFCGGFWCLRMWPNLISGWVWLSLIRKDGGPPKTFTIAAGIREADGIEKRSVVERKFPNEDGWCWEGFCFKSEPTFQSPLPMSVDALTITCEMKTPGKARGVSSYRDASIQTDSEIRELDNGSQAFDKEGVVSYQHESTQTDSEVAAPTNGNQTLDKQAAVQDNKNNEKYEDDEDLKIKENFKQLSQIKNTKKISLPTRHGNVIRSLRAILVEGRRADFTLKSGGGDWLVHRAILESRSGHFETLFRGEWAERDEVRLDDIAEGTLDRVLLFLYTGEVGGVSVENVCGIYAAARRFFLRDLESLCVEYMKGDMCPKMVCGALAIAGTYGEADLKESALECFFRECGRIVDTEEWEEFRKNHPEIVGELFEEFIKRERKNRRKGQD